MTGISISQLGHPESLWAVEAKDLTKRYRVYLKPFDRIKEAILRRPCHKMIEALHEVTFQMAHGDSLGIIGENGAGKSTLLKILAGTVRPTTGTVAKQGRSAALLELGSGFHPEFSGRRNIYLNAALLGLEEKEIAQREKAIVSFSELQDAIDLPVKTYSSGMYMRLGFSIATSIDPDVLMVDEALSVGDQRFQQKCVDRMTGFVRGGKTIVICSHSMYLINEMCAKTLWLRNGKMAAYGKTSQVVAEYLAYLKAEPHWEGATAIPAPGGGLEGPEVSIEEVSVLDEEGGHLERLKQFQTVVFRIRTRRIGPAIKGHVALGIEQLDGQQIFGTTTKISGLVPVEFVGERVIDLVIPSIPVLGGYFRAKAVVGDIHALKVIHEQSSAPFLIESKHPEIGLVWIEHQWRLPAVPSRSAS